MTDSSLGDSDTSKVEDSLNSPDEVPTPVVAPWSLEQEHLLCELVSYSSLDWSLVSLRLQRPLVECQTHYFTVLHRLHLDKYVLSDLLANRIPDRWTLIEDRILVQLSNFNLTPFSQIASTLDRSAQECRERCELLLQPALCSLDGSVSQVSTPVSAGKSRCEEQRAAQRRQAMSPPTPKEAPILRDNGPRPWTQKDVEFVLRMKQNEGKSFAEIGELLGRTAMSCRSAFYRYIDATT